MDKVSVVIVHPLFVLIWDCSTSTRWPGCCVSIVRLDGAGVLVEEKSLDQDGPLHGEGGKEKVETEWGPGVAFQECHEETETDNDHHVDILEPLEKKFIFRQFYDQTIWRAKFQ